MTWTARVLLVALLFPPSPPLRGRGVEGEGVAFLPGTGISHTIINNTEKDVRLLVVGEASRERSRVHYPMHPKRNEEIGGRHWTDRPKKKLWPHDGLPDAQRKR